MRRILSVFLLFLMLVAGVQPTLAMHFCGEDLRSVRLLNEQRQEKTCCGMSRVSDEAGYIQENISSKSCCTSQEVRLTTDDYQYQEKFPLQAKIYHCVDLSWFAFSLLFINNTNRLYSEKLRRDYPPGGFVYLKTGILTSISIIRI